MNGRFKTANIENLLTKYISLYVFCPICKSGNTKIIRENRLKKKVCNNCTSINTVVN